MLKSLVLCTIIMGVLVLPACVLFMRSEPKIDSVRIANRIDHALDIVQDLKELAQNISIKDAVENFTQEEASKAYCCSPTGSDLFSIGAIVEIKSKHLETTLHEILCELRRKL